MGIPAVSYRVVVNEAIDQGFYHLPNSLSHACFSFEELRETLQNILDGKLGAANTAEREILIERFLSAQDGRLACERLIDVLGEIVDSQAGTPGKAGFGRLERWLLRKGLQVARRFKSSLPGTHNRREFQRHRYPEIIVEDIRMRLARLQELLGDRRKLTVEQLSDVSFRVSA